MNKINSLLNAYGESHKNATNKLIHWICVPAIFFSIVGLVSMIPFPSELIIYKEINLSWALIALLLVLIYYVSLSIPLAVGMFLFSIGCLFLCSKINELTYPFWIYLALFGVSWVFQFIGHNIEGKKPSFLKDVQFLLIGPAWLMHFILKKINISL
ncbi:MAG: DUF962 domain-containing protein [Crocinitomicaceae bacterium]|jgi:uncharacterized membrane protein YGL010W|tara:strand:- start:46756 stop:47223 length:468 start_codon:yes stop_codon:yes gene_type:complete